MASLSHTIKSDFRALPRNFRGVVPKLIVLIHVAMLAIVVFSLLSWEDYRVSKWGEDLSWPNWLFLLAGSFWGIPALVVSYLLLTQRLKWTLTILLVGVTVWALWLFWEEYIDGSVLGLSLIHI